MKRFLALSLALALTPLPVLAQDQAIEEAARRTAEISLTGRVAPIETLRLAAYDAGVVKQLRVKEGDRVNAGDVVCELDADRYLAEAEAANLRLQIAREETKNDVDLQYARVSAEVNQQVLEKSRAAARQFQKSISATELERLRLEYERSRLSGLQAERQLKINLLNEALEREQLQIASQRLKDRQLRSTINGQVVQVFFTPGEFVNGGEAVVRILNLDRLRITTFGNADELDPADVGQTAEFEFRSGGETFRYPARISFVSPEIDSVRKTYSIWAEIENTDQRLRSGHIGQLVIKRRSAE